jgi:hypothetical protein
VGTVGSWFVTQLATSLDDAAWSEVLPKVSLSIAGISALILPTSLLPHSNLLICFHLNIISCTELDVASAL